MWRGKGETEIPFWLRGGWKDGSVLTFPDRGEERTAAFWNGTLSLSFFLSATCLDVNLLNVAGVVNRMKFSLLLLAIVEVERRLGNKKLRNGDFLFLNRHGPYIGRSSMVLVVGLRVVKREEERAVLSLELWGWIGVEREREGRGIMDAAFIDGDRRECMSS